jgi:hypothetical protein
MSGGEEKPNGESAAPAVQQVVNVNSELKYIAPVPEPVDVPIAIGPDTIFTGDLLRQIRESQHLSLRDIADRTRISVASLAALESERFEDLPNARVYVRGFIRCVAVEMGLDREHVSRTYLPRWQAWYEAQHAR